MGQTIEVASTAFGAVALFTTDRSLTGQDGVGFDSAPESITNPPAELAARLFAQVDGVDYIHVLSNVVSVRTVEDWDEDLLTTASEVIAGLFIHYVPEDIPGSNEHDQQLRDSNYNATITSIRAQNDDLWVIRVKPDEPVDRFEAGQYTTLALGFWEPRADHVEERFEREQREKLARRSYSVSSSIVDEDGRLAEASPEEIEFYIVQVPPGVKEIPALTPRLFTMTVGDRLFMGRKFTGHYTLDGVEPTDNVVFLSTGTGEAPQNTMIAELLRRGHEGHILSVACVRHRRDLAYTEEHSTISERYPNYRYLTLTTRDPENEGAKVYIQDLVRSGTVEETLGAPLDPANTRFFLCGNPLMIGLPQWGETGPRFPDVVGVCQLLHERGFKIDRRRDRGNVHFEEYWSAGETITGSE